MAGKDLRPGFAAPRRKHVRVGGSDEHAASAAHCAGDQSLIQPKRTNRMIEATAETSNELRQPMRFENMKNKEHLGSAAGQLKPTVCSKAPRSLFNAPRLP